MGKSVNEKNRQTGLLGVSAVSHSINIFLQYVYFQVTLTSNNKTEYNYIHIQYEGYNQTTIKL